MATFRQAIERQRECGTLPLSGDVSVKNLHQIFGPVAGKSTRALQAAMFGSGAERKPWAVILCRFKGDAPDNKLEDPIRNLYRDMFTPGTGGLVEYWRDVSLGVIDISGSRVFDWVEVEIRRDQAGGSAKTVPVGPGRGGLLNFAIRALQRRGDDPLTGFHGQIAVYAYAWSEDNKSQTGAWSDWAQFWLDGSADGLTGRVTLTPPHEGDITAHEMGHGFGMNHDVSADLSVHYADPCCIMSQRPVFAYPKFNANFGPALCLPHLIQKGWMYAHRVYEDTGWWMSQHAVVSYPLAQTCDPGARANLGLKLAYKDDKTNWDYYVEYVRPINWNQGLTNDLVLIRRIAKSDVGDTPSILGQIIVPAVFGTYASFVEPYGNVSFKAERSDPTGRVVKVGVRKL